MPVFRMPPADPVVLKALQVIPGVGPACALDLWQLGINTVAELRGRDAGPLYEALCIMQGCRVDRCMLYVFRCAIYFAETDQPEPAKLKWWYWKDTPT